MAVQPLPLYLPHQPRETLAINFSELYTTEGISHRTTELLEALTLARKTVNDSLLPNPILTTPLEDPAPAINDYISLISGMIADPEGLGAATSSSSSLPPVPDRKDSAQRELVPLSRGVAFTSLRSDFPPIISPSFSNPYR